MHNNQVRLVGLLNQHKINQDEYDILINALNTKQKLPVRIFNFLMNPFTKISTILCLIIGLLVLITLAYVGFKANLNFSGYMGDGFYANKHY